MYPRTIGIGGQSTLGGKTFLPKIIRTAEAGCRFSEKITVLSTTKFKLSYTSTLTFVYTNNRVYMDA